MLLTQLTGETLELLNKIAAAEIVRVDDELYVITEKSKYVDAKKAQHERVEDHEPIFQTDYHVFNWWEIKADTQRINDREWKIGESTVCFLTIQPI